MTQSNERKFTILRGGLYGTPKTPAEKLQAAVRSRYAALKNARGVTPAGPIYQAGEGITTPLGTLARHIALAKAGRTEHETVKRFARGVMADVDQYVDELYGRTTEPPHAA